LSVRFESLIWKIWFFMFKLNYWNCFNFQNYVADTQIKYFILLYVFGLWIYGKQFSIKMKLLEQEFDCFLCGMLENFLDQYERWFEFNNCLLNYYYMCQNVLIHVKLVNWSIFVWLLLLLSLWIVSFIYDYSFYSIIWVDLRFGLCIDWSCFKNMFIMIELQLHVWIQRRFWVVMFKLRPCIFVLLLFMLFLSLKIDVIFVSVAIRFVVFETNFTCCDSLCMCF
jgi:hypothetical protein